MTKQERERAFHNSTFSSNARESAGRFYSVLRASRLFFEENLAVAPGIRVLEYGCGQGTYSLPLARRGAVVTGIDISDVAIDQASAAATKEGLTVEYIRMDAEDLTFPDRSFDLVCGVAILHHLDLDKAYASLARVLKPGGHAVFMEPLAHNPFINLYRTLTPALRTEDEHPLRMDDLTLAERYFGDVEARFFTMNTLLAVPFRNSRFFGRLVKTLDETDRVVFSLLPPLRRFAWQTILVLRSPR